MRFFIKTHKSEKGNVLAVCDSDLLGKILEDKNKILEIRDDFYKGELVDIKKVLEEIENSFTSNIVGNIIIGELIKREIINKENVLEIKGIKHVNIFKI